MRDSNTTHSNAPLAGEARQERGAKRRWRSTCHFNMLGSARSHVLKVDTPACELCFASLTWFVGALLLRTSIHGWGKDSGCCVRGWQRHMCTSGDQSQVLCGRLIQVTWINCGLF